jgi:hypothetical protein
MKGRCRRCRTSARQMARWTEPSQTGAGRRPTGGVRGGLLPATTKPIDQRGDGRPQIAPGLAVEVCPASLPHCCPASPHPHTPIGVVVGQAFALPASPCLTSWCGRWGNPLVFIFHLYEFAEVSLFILLLDFDQRAGLEPHPDHGFDRGLVGRLIQIATEGFGNRPADPSLGLRIFAPG